MAVKSRPAKRPPQLNLAARRANNGVTLEQIAASTKIGIQSLLFIEAERYEELPGGVFTVSYLRQYASAAGLDAGELLEHCRQRMAEREGGGAMPAVRDERKSGWGLWLRALGLERRS